MEIRRCGHSGLQFRHQKPGENHSVTIKDGAFSGKENALPVNPGKIFNLRMDLPARGGRLILYDRYFWISWNGIA